MNSPIDLTGKIIKSLLLGTVVLLSACQDKTVEFFLTNPTAIPKSYDQCLQLGYQAASRSKECLALSEALPIFRAYLLEAVNSPAVFGIHIMQAEIELAKLKEALNKAKLSGTDPRQIENLTSAIAAQKLQIESRLAVLRVIYKMR
jgi:hypothetical protein